MLPFPDYLVASSSQPEERFTSHPIGKTGHPPAYSLFSSYPFTCIVEVPTPVLFTSIITGLRRVSWSIWLITPMVLPDNRRFSSAFKVASRVSLSSVPKPSSKNNDSSLERLLLSSESARASDRLTRNDSPPDKGLDRAYLKIVKNSFLSKWQRSCIT